MSIPPPPGPRQPEGFQGPHAQGQYPQSPYAAPQPQGAHPPPQFPYGPQGPHGPHGPYPPYGPYGFQPPAGAVNGVAIAALVCGLLCFLPAVGLVLGLIALWQIRRRSERGRGMAIAGSVLSSVGLALWVLSLSTNAAADFWEGFKEGARGNTILLLEEGDCFDSPDGLVGWTIEADQVPCSQEHDGEVFALVTLPDGAFPGDDSLVETADDRCYALQDGYAMDAWALPSDVDVYHITPSRESWDYGDRVITCVFGNRDADATLTGSLRRDESTLDADQVAYLKATHVLNAALDQIPVEEAEEDLPGNQKWAGQMSEALAEQSGMLREHEWPADAERPVTKLAGELEKAEAAWAKAAEADGLDAFYEHSAQGWELIDSRKTVTARKALGLATTPPTFGEDESESEDGTGSGDGGADDGSIEV
ncbi:DUF4190 domain-containing protein [Streptomyces sp. M2CJ-2]|uniref:DUF4190 domain-containing protein n=1 Tax=Streptomyces sp. M2CJ-2 TaxID=2803948 RepID=UPI001920693D|nr:DUF4190 domain-containing protein [Streptomyces sp. M2CJ-2]MBL3665730.1 DUF4190 domain-containing protein [Streptomyces sp. M2CJ-2]